MYSKHLGTVSGQADWDEIVDFKIDASENKNDRGTSIEVDSDGNIAVLGRNGTQGGNTEYTTVRYAKKELVIPPDSEAASSAISFIENRGQLTDTSGAEVPAVKFYSDAVYPPVYIQDHKLSFVTSSVDTSATMPDTLHRVDIAFKGSKTAQEAGVFGMDKRGRYNNYYLGHIPEGRARVGLYERAIQTDVYDGIDLHYYSNQGGMKYYFVLSPGKDPATIELEFSGQSSLSVDTNGDLVVGTSVGDFRLPAPEAYQVDSTGQEVSTGWTPGYSVSGSVVTFLGSGSYDVNLDLVIRIKREQPITPVGNTDEWVTHFGGEESFIEDLYALEVEDNGGIFVGGITSTTDFPLVPGDITMNNSAGGSLDAHIARFNDQAVIQYLTIFGGGDVDILRDITVMGSSIVAVGETRSNDFPLSSGTGNANGIDAFVTELLVSSGEMGISKIYGGDENDTFLGVSSLGTNGVLIAGHSSNTNFPTVSLSGAYNQSSNNSLTFDDRDAIIVELNDDFSIKWSTYFGGRDFDIAGSIVYNIKSGHFYVAGNTAAGFYAPSNNCAPPSVGSGFPHCQPSGATQIQFANGATTSTSSTDIFIAEFDKDRALVWSTFLGGGEQDQITMAGNSNIAVNPKENGEIALIGGTNEYSSMPSNPGGGYSQSFSGGGLFIAKFKDRVHTWSSAYGCMQSASSFPFLGEACLFDESGRLFLLGHTDCPPQDFVNYCTEPSPSSNEFPICPPSSGSNAFFQSTYQGVGDAFIASFDENNNLLYSTYFGGNNEDFIRGVEFDKNSRLHFVGQSSSTASFPWRFPNTPTNVYEQPFLFGSEDGFIARLNMSLLVNSSDHIENDSRLLTFPNPSNETLNIRIPDALNKRNLPYQVFDSKGALVLTGATDRQAVLTLRLKGLSSGVYIFTLPGQSIKFIKQ